MKSFMIFWHLSRLKTSVGDGEGLNMDRQSKEKIDKWFAIRRLTIESFIENIQNRKLNVKVSE